MAVSARLRFDPKIEVISEQPQDRQPADLSYAAVLTRFPCLEGATAVGLTGSTAAGWGNPFSDIDLYAFSEHELELPHDETAEEWPGAGPRGLKWQNWMGRYGDHCVDLTVWPVDALYLALGPCLEGEPEFFPDGGAVPEFIYRATNAVPVKNPEFFDQMKHTLSGSSYPRSLARHLKGVAENHLEDAAGQLAMADFGSARLSASMAADTVTDMCLVLAGQLCRRRKWLIRRLDETPSCGITSDDYRSMVIGGLRRGESEGDCAERVARWAQSHLVRVEHLTLITS